MPRDGPSFFVNHIGWGVNQDDRGPKLATRDKKGHLLLIVKSGCTEGAVRKQIALRRFALSNLEGQGLDA